MNIKSKEIKEYDTINNCLICRNESYSNINRGDFKICSFCNKKVINSNIMDLNYDYYKDKIKRMLFSKYNIKI